MNIGKDRIFVVSYNDSRVHTLTMVGVTDMDINRSGLLYFCEYEY